MSATTDTTIAGNNRIHFARGERLDRHSVTGSRTATRKGRESFAFFLVPVSAIARDGCSPGRDPTSRARPCSSVRAHADRRTTVGMLDGKVAVITGAGR